MQYVLTGDDVHELGVMDGMLKREPSWPAKVFEYAPTRLQNEMKLLYKLGHNHGAKHDGDALREMAGEAA